MPYIGNVITSFAVETGSINDQAVTAPKLSATGGTDGQVLALDSNLNLEWVSDPAGQWVTSGSNIHYNDGNVGIGLASPSDLLEITPTSTREGLTIKTTGTTFGGINIDTNRTGAGHTLGDIRFMWNGTGVAGITGHTGADTTNKDDGRLIFNTASSGSATERMRIDSSGNVGIGTSSPSVLLHVSSSGDTIARVTSADGNGAFLDLGDASDPDGGRIVYDSGSNLTFSTGSTERLRIDSSGEVGIGTTSPGTKLDVNDGSANCTIRGRTGNGFSSFLHLLPNGSGSGISLAANSDSSAQLFNQLNSHLAFGTNNTERMRIDIAGNVGVNTSNPQAELHLNDATGLSRIRLSGGANSADNFEFGQGTTSVTNGGFEIRDVDESATRFVINSSGNVGIGTTSPARPLSVSSSQISARFTSSSSDSQIEFVDSSGTVVYGSASGGAIVQTGSSERMRIDSSGRLMLGTTTVYSPSGGGSTPVTVVDGGNHRTNLVISNQTNHADAGAAAILAAHGQDWILEATSVLKGNRDFTITAGTNERLRLDNSGRFLYGTDTGVNLNNASGGSAREAKAYVYNTASVTSERYNLGLITGNNGVAGPTVFLSKTRASSNTHTVVQSGDEVGDIRFTGSDGTFFVEAARIKGKVDGTPGSQDMPGRLEFHTTADGASGTTERMRIDSSGRVGIGTSSPGSKLQIVDTMQATANGHNQLSIIGDDSGTNGESARIFLSAINATNRGCGIVSERQSSSNDHDLILQTNSGGNTPSERMRIDSSGNVGINISNPTQQLHVDCGAPSSSDKIIGLFQSESSRQIYLGWDDSQSTMVLGTLTDHALCIHTSGQNTERIRIDSEGLKFHGDTAAANALNDYEEGTWTPSFGIGSVTVTDAVYTKVGRLVTVTARVSIPNTTNSATVNIGGLPFTPDGFMNSAMGGIVGETTLTTTDRPVATVEAAGNSIRFRQNGATALTFANLSQQTLRWMATYFTDQ